MPHEYAVVTVAYRSRALLQPVMQRFPPSTPIIVVDNSSHEEEIHDLVRTRPMTTYIDSGGNVGFGAACNLAARVASQPFLAFVNPDAEVDASVLDRLVAEVRSDPRIASAGPLLDADEGERSASGGWLPTPARALVHATGLFRVLPHSGIWLGTVTQSRLHVDWLAATCLVIRRDAFLELGGFASRYFLYQEDMDLGRRLREQHYQQVLVGDLRVRHAAGKSSASPDVRRLAWLRASALVDYLAATQSWPMVRLTCAILAAGAILRAGYHAMRGRTARLGEFATHAVTLTCPARTLQKVHAERQRRTAPATPRQLADSH